MAKKRKTLRVQKTKATLKQRTASLAKVKKAAARLEQEIVNHNRTAIAEFGLKYDHIIGPGGFVYVPPIIEIPAIAGEKDPPVQNQDLAANLNWYRKGNMVAQYFMLDRHPVLMLGVSGPVEAAQLVEQLRPGATIKSPVLVQVNPLAD